MPVALRKGTKYTYHDYLTWPDEERWEVIEGVAYDMGPAPSVKHQEIVSSFHVAIKTHPDNKCFTGIATTDVVLDEHNVVQPDVFVVCDRSKIGERAITGAPDLVIEVVSPATEVKDRREKKAVYEKFGVGEYILVFPEREYVERYLLEEGKYGAPEIVNWDETIKVVTLGMDINLWEIFEKEKPREEEPEGEEI